MDFAKRGLSNIGRTVTRISSPDVIKDVTFDQAFSGKLSAGPFNSYSSKKEQLEAYRDWIYAAVSAISEECASIDFRVFINRTSTSNRAIGYRLSYKPGEVKDLFRRRVVRTYTYGTKSYTRTLKALEEVETHPMIDLLEKPNRWMDKDEFFEREFQHLELAGDAFILKIRNGMGVVEELWPLMPDIMNVIPDSQNFIAGYVYMINGKRVPFDVSDIIHIKRTDPSNMVRGLGVVEAAARAVDNDAQSADYNRRFFKNAARPDGALETDNELSEQSFNRLKKEFKEQYAGTDNAHKTVLLEGGVKFNPVNFSQKEMDFLNSRKFNRDEILAMVRVSPSILGMVEDVNRSNAEASEYIFSKRVVKHKMNRMVSKLTSDLAAEFDEKLVVSFTDPVPADKEFDLKSKSAAVDKWMTKDEVREQDGMDPLPNGAGSVIYQPISQQPIGTNSGGSGDDRGFSTTSGQRVDNGKKKLAGDGDDDSGGIPVYSNDEEREKIGNDFSGFVERIAPQFEDQFIDESRTRFNQQRLEVLRNIDASDYEPVEQGYTRAQRRDLLDDFMFDKGKENRLMAAAFAPIYKDMIDKFGEQAILLVSATQPFDTEDPAIAEFYDNRSEKIAKDVNSETEKQLRATISEGVNAGESIDEIKNRVSLTMGNIADYRSRRIARTESIRTNTFADITAWDQTGEVRYKEWFIADGDACIWCQDMNGKKTDVQTNYFDKDDSMFVDDENGNQHRLDFKYEDITGPPLHVNCRCVLLPVLKDI